MQFFISHFNNARQFQKQEIHHVVNRNIDSWLICPSGFLNLQKESSVIQIFGAQCYHPVTFVILTISPLAMALIPKYSKKKKIQNILRLNKYVIYQAEFIIEKYVAVIFSLCDYFMSLNQSHIFKKRPRRRSFKENEKKWCHKLLALKLKFPQ